MSNANIPWGSEIPVLALGIVGLGLGISNWRGKLDLSWAKRVRSDWFPLRLIAALLPTSVCLLSFALMLPSLTSIHSKGGPGEALLWIVRIILILLFASSLSVSVYAVSIKVPRFLVPPSQRFPS